MTLLLNTVKANVIKAKDEILVCGGGVAHSMQMSKCMCKCAPVLLPAGVSNALNHAQHTKKEKKEEDLSFHLHRRILYKPTFNDAQDALYLHCYKNVATYGLFFFSSQASTGFLSVPCWHLYRHIFVWVCKSLWLLPYYSSNCEGRSRRCFCFRKIIIEQKNPPSNCQGNLSRFKMENPVGLLRCQKTQKRVFNSYDLFTQMRPET